MFILPIKSLVAFAIAATSPQENPVDWPKEIAAEQATITLYQPQLESFEGDKLTARAAVSGIRKGETEPIFGAVWLVARVATDRDSRMVELLDVDVPRATFPDADQASIDRLSALLKKEIPTWDVRISLDRLLTSLELAKKEDRVESQLQTDAPRVVYRKNPAVLVTLDGEPILMNAEDTSMTMRVVNTPFFLVLDLQTNDYYLKGGDAWLTSKGLDKGWLAAQKVPPKILLYAAAETGEVISSGVKSGTAPEIIVTQETAELVVTEGEPRYEPFAGLDLAAVSNTDSDLLRAGPLHYLLLAGRWYSTPSLETGPWTYVAPDALPESFANIPADSEYASLLSSVAGTVQAQDAVLETYIPQTSRIQRSDASLVVEYDGSPKFEPIEGTSMQYAVNTPYSVIRVGIHYYCCEEAVWYESLDPLGPWVVCVEVPDVIYTIPPSNPVYEVRYVYVYSHTPDVVYVGYLPGYVGCYHYRGVVVYGTGYHYHRWHGSYYYPRPCTYGYAARYNPHTGSWGFHVGHRGGGSWVGFGVHHHGHRWWGRGGYHRADVRVSRNVNSNVISSPNVNHRNLYNRKANIARNVATKPRVTTRPARTPRVTPTRRNNVYADRDGKVHRRTDQGWQSRDRSGWKDSRPAAAPDPSPTRRSDSRTPTRSSPSRSTLDRAHTSRQRGAVRTNMFRRSKGGGRGGRR